MQDHIILLLSCVQYLLRIDDFALTELRVFLVHVWPEVLPPGDRSTPGKFRELYYHENCISEKMHLKALRCIFLKPKT